MRRCARALLAGLALGLATPAMAQVDVTLPVDDDPRPELALMGTIPIYWGEAADMAEALSGTVEAHWARASLERHYRLSPLDYLSADALEGHRYLLMAQPRGLSAEENVALDDWVRGGGHLLLFADPMLTGHSRFGIGDRRRPQDTVLLSPIFGRWGLELQFDEKGDGAGQREFQGLPIAVDLPGEFALRDDGHADCRLESGGLIASCSVGDGRAVVVADAAMLDLEDRDDRTEAMLEHLLDASMGNLRDDDASPHGETINSAGNQ